PFDVTRDVFRGLGLKRYQSTLNGSSKVRLVGEALEDDLLCRHQTRTQLGLPQRAREASPILRIEHQDDSWYLQLSGDIELELHERSAHLVTLHRGSALEPDDAEVNVAPGEPPTARLGRCLILRSERGGLFLHRKALKGGYYSDRRSHEARG